MSRSAKSKRKRRQRGRPPSPAARRRPWWIVAVIALVAVAFATSRVMRRTSLRSQTGPSLVSVPDPDTSEMQPRVSELIGETRNRLLRRAGSADAWGSLGEVCDAHLLYDTAEQCYWRAHRMAPGNFRWAYLLAIVRDLRGAPADEVVERFETAAAIIPNYPPLYVRYGDALVRQGRMSDARDAYARAVELDEDFAMAHRSLGQVLLALDEPQKALEHLAIAARYAPDDGLAHAGLAQAYTLLGDRANAARSAEQSRRLPRRLGLPDPIRFEVEALGISSELCSERADQLIAEGNWAEALKNLRIVEETRPRDPDVRRRIDLCLEQLGPGTP